MTKALLEAAKECCNCGTVTKDFGKYDKRGRTYTRSQCRPCVTKRRVEWLYQLPTNGVQILIEKQGGVCPICLEPLLPDQKLSVDHDHSCCVGDGYEGSWKTCGKCTRGVLHQGCNFGLGVLGDSVETLQRAIEYLSRGGL